MKNGNKTYYISDSILVTAPVIIGAVIGEYLIFKDGADMNTSIVVALIAVAGAIAGNIFTLLRDRNIISRIDSKSSEMEPRTKEIKEKADKISEYTVEKIYPDVKRIYSDSKTHQDKVMKLIGDIHEDVRYKQRLSKEYAGRLSKDIMVTGIEDVYQENASLINKVHELELRNNDLETQLEIRDQEIKKLKEHNTELRNSMHKYTDKDHEIEI